MKINIPTVLWVLDYITNRLQFVKASPGDISKVIRKNTGAPQGTVLSPLLFGLYTADCKNAHASFPITTFADDTGLTGQVTDDTGLTGQITDDDDSCYRQEIDHFIDWCDQNYLQLNVGKTKEMVIDFRKKKLRKMIL